MSPKRSNTHDGYVTEDDLKQFRERINRGELQQLVIDLMVKEPDIAIAVSLREQKLTAMLQGLPLTAEQRDKIDKHVRLSVWLPLITLSHAHRRAWDGVLPATDDDDYGPVTAEET